MTELISQYVAAHGHPPGVPYLVKAAGVTAYAASRALREYRTAHPDLPANPMSHRGAGRVAQVAPNAPQPTVSGYTARMDPARAEQDAYERAIRAQSRTASTVDTKSRQVVSFPHGPVALTFVGDVHFGNSATDYQRAFDEAELIASTPGMYAVTCGDILDQFVIGRLAAARFNAPLSIQDEWHLVKRWLRILAPKLRVSVAGNHDNWAQTLTGVDFFREVLGSIAPDCLYDTDDCRFTWRVGDAEKNVRVRHKWSGSSIYNPTHAIERAAKWDQDFDIGVGAHTHTGGFSRDATAGGRHILAVQTGAYKRNDAYMRQEGFALPNNSTAVAVVLTDKGELQGFNSLKIAADYMRLKWGR